MIRLSIVILSWNTKDLLRRCLESVVSGPRSLPYEVLVVDNGSEDGSGDMVRELYPEVRLIGLEKNIGYAAGNNVGIREAHGDYILLLNSDTEVVGSAPEILASFLDDHREYGAASCRLLNPDGSVQRGCKRFPTLKTALFWETLWERAFGPTRFVKRYIMDDFDHVHSCDVDQPPGAVFMMPRRILDEVGLFDESLWLFFNDVDLCRRIHYRGYRIRYIAEETVLHHEGASTKKFRGFIREWNVNRMRYYRKHYGKRGAFLIYGLTALRALEERIRIFFRHKGPDRKAASEGVSEIMRALREELALAASRTSRAER